MSEKWLAELKDWVKTFVIALLIVLIIHQFGFNVSVVNGHSMEPTLQDKERLFVNKAVYLLGEPHRGDVVVLKDPRPAPEVQYLVKRVVAVPGDTVEIRQNKLYVNGELYEKPHTANAPIDEGEFGPLVIPDKHYYVMGDNRSSSVDSRRFGVVEESAIRGRAEFILWPLDKIGGL